MSATSETVKELKKTLEAIESFVTDPSEDYAKDCAGVSTLMLWANRLVAQLADDVAFEFKRRPCPVIPFLRVSR